MAQVSVEPKQVGLDDRILVLNCGRNPDVDGRGTYLVLEDRLTDVDSLCRDGGMVWRNIGCREAEGDANPPAFDDFAGDGVLAAQQTFGLFEVALKESFAYSGAADALAFNEEGRDLSGGESEFAANLLEEVEVSEGVFSEA